MKDQPDSLAKALDASRLKPSTRRAIKAKITSGFSKPSLEAIGALTSVDEELNARERRYADGRPETSHIALATKSLLDAVDPVVSAHGANRRRFDGILPDVAGIILHDIPENRLRGEVLKPASEAAQTALVKNGMRDAYELRRTVKAHERELKISLVPKLRTQYIDKTVYKAIPLLEAVAARYFRSNGKTPIDKLFGISHAEEVLLLTVDFFTPFRATNSVLNGTYADLPRFVYSYNPSGVSETDLHRATDAFIRGKHGGDRKTNTATMEAATNAVRQLLGLEVLEAQYEQLTAARGSDVYGKLQEKFARAVYKAVDDAKRHKNFKTPDSLDQNINDFKNTILISETLRYLKNRVENSSISARDLALNLHAVGALAKATKLHARKHKYSIAVHGIRERMNDGSAHYHRLNADDGNLSNIDKYVQRFLTTKGNLNYETISDKREFKMLAHTLSNDHLAEAGGVDAVPKYAYDPEKYIINAAIYEQYHSMVASALLPVNESLRRMDPSVRDKSQLLPLLASVPCFEGSISSLAR